MKNFFGVRRRHPSRLLRSVAAGIILPLFWAAEATATPFLADWGVNIDGVTICWIGLCDGNEGKYLGEADGVDDSGFDYGSGLGVVGVTLAGQGDHYVGLFLDHDLGNDSFFDETAAFSGSVAAGQSWEMDEPGYIGGDIFTNLMASWLDNMIGPTLDIPEDVSMALGWDFTLGAGETAFLQFMVSDIAPIATTNVIGGVVSTSDLMLIQTDSPNDTGESIYMSSSLTIQPQEVPAPGTLLLLLAGLIACFSGRRGVSEH